MSFQTPKSKCTVHVEGLGNLDGWEYPNGVQQFCGIPYASLPKRWTRAQLQTTWPSSHHDGTKLGNSCPNPILDGPDLTPVPPNPLFNEPGTDELTALNINIVRPPPSVTNSPVLGYVHGGSLLFGGANLSIFDAVNLVSISVMIGKPIVVATFNYRVGLGGFLASAAIKEELQRDGYAGCGNFGLTDQQVAFEWINRYIPSLGGDPENVTAVGESAGGISISHQLLAANRPKFHRAVCMSGLSASIPSWTMEEHERLFQAVCQCFDIAADDPQVLELLRSIPQQDLADATDRVHGVPASTGNPCLDGWFHSGDPLEPHEAPLWLKSYMLGDVYHEGIIFHPNLLDDDYDFIHSTLHDSIGDDAHVNEVLRLYEMFPDTPQHLLLERFEHMAGDAVFKIPNFVTANLSTRLQADESLFRYHFDQRTRMKGPLEGTAYHAYELLYLFQNLNNKLNTEELSLAESFVRAWIAFCHGDKPWETGTDRWMVWGPDGRHQVKSEAEDETARDYTRFKSVLNMGEGNSVQKKWLRGVDTIVNKRMRIGTFRS
ncbi:Alpha/Beta hydrolase protein [Diaporthe sp. PMI_573]|nr:Alpha/Beta hydrolase protein [Diaporthaceae sp. PMI_573]